MSVRPLFIKIPVTFLISIVAFLCKLEIEGIILILIISIELERAIICLENLTVEYYFQTTQKSIEIAEIKTGNYEDSSIIASQFTDDQKAELLTHSIKNMATQKIPIKRIFGAAIFAAITFFSIQYLLNLLFNLN
jgi:hypothetical protein